MSFVNKVKNFFMGKDAAQNMFQLLLLVVVVYGVWYLFESVFMGSSKPVANGKAGGKQVVFFHMDGCGHCKKFMPTWDKFAKQSPLPTVKTEVKEKHPLNEVCKPQGYPSVCMVENGKKVAEYKGDRSFDDLMTWASS